MLRLTSLVCFACLALLAACSDPDPVRSTDAAAAPDATDAPEDVADSGDADPGGLVRTPTQDGVSPDGHPAVAERLAAGQVRAGRIEADETGFHGLWAHCRPGDFKLYNAEIAVCIQQKETNRFEVLTGGMIVDAKRVGDDSPEVLDFVRPLVGLGTISVESIEVIRDGSEGGPAVVRVEAKDAPVAHLVGVLGDTLVDAQDIRLTTEYRLEPDSDTVEMVSWYTNPNDGGRAVFVGDWFGYGDRANLWTPGRGMGPPGGRYGWLAAITATDTLGWIVAVEEAREVGLSSQGLPWAGSRAKNLRLRSGDEDVFQRWLVVGDSLETIRERAAELRGEPLDGQTRTFSVRTGAGQAVAGRGVLARRGDEPVTWGRTDAEGNVELRLAEGDWELVVDGWPAGAEFVREVSVPDDDSLTVEAPAVLKLDVTDADTDQPLTARVVVRNQETGSVYDDFALHGAAELELVGASHEILVYHGPEYDAAVVDVELDAGATVERSVALSRAFDTDGWLSGDFHQHMEPSLDSVARVDKRVLENAALGVDILVSTDHESVTDLRPLIDELGLGEQLVTFAGVEISPIETHVGLYPMDFRHEKPGGGTIRLAYADERGEVQRRLIPEVVDIARGLPSDPVVQLNHARRSSSGMLELVGYDPEIGSDGIDDSRFTLDFDTIEITNRFGDTCRLFADWSGLLNTGHRFTGLGNSDTHGLTGESGLPRNYLRIPGSVDQLDASQLREALRDGRVTVGAHAFIDFADGTLPGDVIASEAGQSVELQVRVQTPAWARAQRLLAVVNGEVVDTIERPDGAGEHLDFDQTVSLDVEEDAWVVFFAHGPAPAGAVPSSKPVLAFTNPVYIDVDGDTDADGDVWEAPGARALSLDALDQFCH